MPSCYEIRYEEYHAQAVAKLESLRAAYRELARSHPGRLAEINRTMQGRRGAPLHIIATELGYLASLLMGSVAGDQWVRSWDLYSIPVAPLAGNHQWVEHADPENGPSADDIVCELCGLTMAEANAADNDR